MRAIIWATMLVAAPVTEAGAQKTTANRPARPVEKPPARAHPIPTSGILNAADLVAIARLQANVADDQFSDDPVVKYLGRDFTVEIPTSDLDITYDRETRKLTGSTSKFLDGVILGRDITETKVPGQNGFGARALVTKVRGNAFGIWLPGSSIYNRKPITYSTEMDGASARTLSTVLKLRVSGRIEKAEGPYANKGSVIYKKPLMIDATVSSPLDVRSTSWFLAVSFTKAEWIDSRSGVVIGTSEVAPQ